jgi:hypothetical protein
VGVRCPGWRAILPIALGRCPDRTYLYGLHAAGPIGLAEWRMSGLARGLTQVSLSSQHVLPGKWTVPLMPGYAKRGQAYYRDRRSHHGGWVRRGQRGGKMSGLPATPQLNLRRVSASSPGGTRCVSGD